MKIYRGHTGGRVEVHDGATYAILVERFDLRERSGLPDAPFAWGRTACSGPAQLALAILADFLGDDARALVLFRDFKTRVIVGLRANDNFELDAGTIRFMVERIDQGVA